MRRREFITLVGSAATWPLAARAQQPTMPVIGWLSSGSVTPQYLMAAFHDGLKEFGYVEDRNVAIEYRRADWQYDRLPALAADLVGRQVSVIVAIGNVNTAVAARVATMTVPIVFSIGADPVRSSLVASLDRPGGNMTGITSLGYALGKPRVEMLGELLPHARAFAMLLNPKNLDHQTTQINIFARFLGVRGERVTAGTESEIEPAIASLAEMQVDGLFVAPDPFFFSKRDSLVASLTRHAMPATFPDRESVVAGGLMSHGANYADANRLLGTYVGRVLKGEKPANLPIATPQIDLVINLKTAKAFGLTIPNSLLAKATELIE